jgi:hypothetical protein
VFKKLYRILLALTRAWLVHFQPALSVVNIAILWQNICGYLVPSFDATQRPQRCVTALKTGFMNHLWYRLFKMWDSTIFFLSTKPGTTVYNIYLKLQGAEFALVSLWLLRKNLPNTLALLKNKLFWREKTKLKMKINKCFMRMYRFIAPFI